MQAYKTEVQNWKIYYQPGGYQANGDYVTLSSFATLGTGSRFDDDGIPMVLNTGEWVYNTVTIANFALYHHTPHLRGAALDPAFWRADLNLASKLALKHPEANESDDVRRNRSVQTRLPRRAADPKRDKVTGSMQAIAPLPARRG